MTAKFFDIFSRTHEIIKKDLLIQKVEVDYREKNSMVPSLLKKLGLDVEFKELKIADYIVKDIAIERKTISDFINSMINRRLLKQLEELQQYKNKILIIEGFEEQELYNDNESNGINPNSIRGFILSILLKHKIPIIFTKNQEDTAKYIQVISKKKQTPEPPLNLIKKSLNKKEQLQFIIESFPGIGPKTAKKLLKEFKTIKNIIAAENKDIEKAIGKKADVFKIVDEEF